ncbi:MAG: lipopolysaccharide ABC transporter substrate-binding protein LptA [Enterobacteriaceae bacterium]
MKCSHIKQCRTLLLSGLLILSLTVMALKEDTEQPINIDSTHQSLDLESNTVTFTGDVVVKQGSIDIRADKVVVIRPEGKKNAEIVEAYGNPVTFYQLQDNGKPVKGRGQKLRYELAKDFLELTGNAYLEQLDSNVKGDRITYLIPAQQMEAFSNKGSRVSTVLVPSQLQDKKEQTPANDRDNKKSR